jgi:toxin ParE1/3/4
VYKVEIEPGAADDINNACIYYLSLLVDTDRLIESFLNDIEASLEKLKLSPKFNFKTKNYRALPLHKFPYILMFTVDDESRIVSVIALFHTSQNPIKYPI